MERGLTLPFHWRKNWNCQSIKDNQKNFMKYDIYTVKETHQTDRLQTNANNKVKESISVSGLPKRFIFTLLGFLGFLICFALRVNLNVAMVAMVRPSALPETESIDNKSEVCIDLMTTIPFVNNTIIHSRVQLKGEFDWDSKLQHLALGSFYFGYMAAQIPGGIIAKKFYAKHFFGARTLITAVFALLTPMAARHSIGALIVVRTIQGISQAAAWPAMYTLIGRWAPTMERSRVSAIIYTGCPVGIVVSYAVSGFLCQSSFLGGWPSVFYTLGTFGVIWFIFWTWFIYETPDSHPHISKAEIQLIKKGREEIKKMPIPWKSILKSLPVYGLTITHFGGDWGGFTLLTETPLYLSNVLHYDLKENGMLSALPNIICTVMGFLSSTLADKLRKKGIFSITVIRKIFNSIGFYGPGICILLVTFMGCSPSAIIILLCLARGLTGFIFSGCVVTHVDMSPEFAGILMAITNTTACIPGFVVAIFVGYIISDGNTLHNWNIVFITAFSVYVICGTVFNVLCSAELQKWQTPVENIPDTHDNIKSSSL